MHYDIFDIYYGDYLKLKSGIKKNLDNVNLPLGLYFRWSSMNWQGQRAETQWRGGTERPVMLLLRSCESITKSSLRRTKWRAHREAYLSNSNSARSCQHILSSFSIQIGIWFIDIIIFSLYPKKYFFFKHDGDNNFLYTKCKTI